MRPEREAAEGYMRIRKAYIRTLRALLALALWLWPIQTEAVQAPGEEAPAPLELRARAAVLMDGDTGRILYGKNQDQTLPMASTTKIMTCILALENASLDDVVEVSSYAASMPEVQLNIREGEQYRLEDLLYSLMLESHNDTALGGAEVDGDGGISLADGLGDGLSHRVHSSSAVGSADGEDAETAGWLVLRWLGRCQGSGPAAGDSQGKYSNCREGGKKMSDHSSTPFHFSNGSQSKAAFIITRKPPEIQPVF